MSEENVELVRRAYAALTRADTDTLNDLAAPELVVDFSRRLLDPLVLRGRDEALRFILSEPYEEWEGWPLWEPQELIDADDKVVALIRFSARGRESGVEVDAQVWNLWTFRDGKWVEVKYFGEDRAAALEAAGLQE
ncbi:MAG TPA: nuclear transport factor 2 family protein [Solirubrobacterales bacterium]